MSEGNQRDESTIGSTHNLFQGEKGETLDDLEEKGKGLFAGKEMETFNSLLAEGYAFLVTIELAPMMVGAEGVPPAAQIQTAIIDDYLKIKKILFEMINNAKQILP